MQRRIRTPLKFLAVGAANTLVGLLAIYLCKWLLGFNDVAANITGYLTGLCVSFLLNRSWTFRHTGATLSALARFLTVFVLAYLINLATVLVAIHGLAVNTYLAQAMGIAPYTLLFYFGSKYFAFRPLPLSQK